MKTIALCFLLVAAAPSFSEQQPAFDVVLLEESSHPQSLRLTATLDPMREAELTAEVPGAIVSRFTELGQRVEPGQLLLQLDSRRLELQLQLRNAELQGAQSQFELAAQNLDRTEALFRDSNLSEEALDQSRYQHDSARSRRDIARAAASLARLDLTATAIHAPFAGEIAILHFEVGERIAPGQAILRLASRDTVVIRAEVSASALKQLEIGLQAKVEPADGRPPFPAYLARIGRVADPVSRRYPIEFVAADPSGPLGQLASLTVVSNQDQRGVDLPATALRFRAGRAYAFVVEGTDSNHILRERQVQIGTELPGGLFFITDGLAPGERVVKLGATTIIEGQAIDIARTIRMSQERAVR